MRRGDRLFDIIQALRTARGPVTAATLAAQLGVTPRTVYRDIAALQARRVPVEGAAGVGYMLRRGFDLPPLMFTAEEIEAIAVGMRMLSRTGDAGLAAAADGVLSKVTTALPEALRALLAAAPLFVPDRGARRPPPAIGLTAIRDAIRRSRKISLDYVDERGRQTYRTIWPIAVAYYVDTTLIGAWCELRTDYRHFRVDRIAAANVLDERFDPANGRLLAGWLEAQERHDPSG